jgi:hypothetical protein
MAAVMSVAAISRQPAGISSISPPNTDGPVILTARADAKYLAALHAPSASDNG